MQFNIITKESQVVKGIFKTFLTFFEKFSSERKIMVFFRRKIGLFAVRKSVAEKKEAPHGRASSAIINYVDIEPRFFLLRRRFFVPRLAWFCIFSEFLSRRKFLGFFDIFLLFLWAFSERSSPTFPPWWARFQVCLSACDELAFGPFISLRWALFWPSLSARKRSF